jgi:hypothetical protein
LLTGLWLVFYQKQPQIKPSGPPTFLGAVWAAVAVYSPWSVFVLLVASAAGKHYFGSFKVLPPNPFAPPVAPPPSAALSLLHKLASDPAIASVMEHHGWTVPLLSEMPPGEQHLHPATVQMHSGISGRNATAEC